MICFKFEQDRAAPLRDQIVLSSVLFHLVNASLYNLAPESVNSLPYTTFKSSAKNIDKMQKAGVKFYTPDQKLGFHNDVFFRGGKYYIPKYVSLINLFIGYDRPGNFYYLNQEMWEDFDDFYERGKNQKFKFRPTPVVYESHIDKGAETSPMDAWYDVPVFWGDKSGQKYAFSNGELCDQKDTSIIAELKASLLNNKRKLAVPQSVNQVVVFRNDKGFHSRDIFKEQRVFEGITRLFLRSVSEQAVDLPVW
ncbi:MAG: hypothetical protein ACK4NR_11315 [Micavibrio sp.]